MGLENLASSRGDVTENWLRQARSSCRNVIFVDGEDERVIKAAASLGARGIVRPILLGSWTDIRRISRQRSITLPSSIDVISRDGSQYASACKEILTEVARKKGRSQTSSDQLNEDPLFIGASLVRLGVAEGSIAGATRPTGDVVRAGLAVLGTQPTSGFISSLLFMILPEGRTLGYADCAVNPSPNAGQLANIALASAKTYGEVMNESPVVAMLSFSTKGSAHHAEVSKVRRAVNIVQSSNKDIEVDGEIQFDAAWNVEVGRSKAPTSSIPGRSNVFIFPNLDAGNIACKITEWLGEAMLVGPLLQGFRHPFNDLSRGCRAEDIIVLAALTALQASSDAQ